MECSIINLARSLLMKHPVTGQRQKAHNFSPFNWSPHGSLVFIWSACRNHEGSTFIEKDRNKLNYRIGPKWTLSPNQTRLRGPCIVTIAGYSM